MYGKPAITCFKYQVVLYGLKAITYLKVGSGYYLRFFAGIEHRVYTQSDNYHILA